MCGSSISFATPTKSTKHKAKTYDVTIHFAVKTTASAKAIKDVTPGTYLGLDTQGNLIDNGTDEGAKAIGKPRVVVTPRD